MSASLPKGSAAVTSLIGRNHRHLLDSQNSDVQPLVAYSAPNGMALVKAGPAESTPVSTWADQTFNPELVMSLVTRGLAGALALSCAAGMAQAQVGLTSSPATVTLTATKGATLSLSPT